MEKKDKLIILMGPTAVGKTDTSIRLAQILGGEIISADSMQIYKYMDIGTAKICPDEMGGIYHHLVDFLEPDQDYSVADYQRDASNLISQINRKGQVPIIVGGTGLYINSLIYDIGFGQVEANDTIRQKYIDLGQKYGNDYLLDLLKGLDIKSYERINRNDTKRIIRALEINEITGRPMDYDDFRKLNDKYDLHMFCLNMDREALYERINTRVSQMVKNGLVGEVETLIKKGYTKDLSSMAGIGYKEIINFLEEDIELDQAIELIKKNSRNYAKRQLTWFRRDKRIKWIDVDRYIDVEDIVMEIINNIDGSI